MSDVNTSSYIEQQKIVFDYIKHITTLNTGSVVLLAALLEKLFKTKIWKNLGTQYLILNGPPHFSRNRVYHGPNIALQLTKCRGGVFVESKSVHAALCR